MKKMFLALGALTLVAGCNHMGGEKHADAHENHAMSHSGHAAHWGYEGDAAPEHWGGMKEEYALCGSGKMQSPVDIRDDQAGALSAIEFNYQAVSNPQVVNNGHTIQVNYAAGSYAVIHGKRYDLLQFHFHSPSEHTLYGKPADMVAHLVHKAADGELAVVAVLFNKSSENAVLKPVWEGMPHHEGKGTVMATINAADLLPADHSYFHYVGSLTTPPCSEGVKWQVLKNPVSVSADQVAAFTGIFPHSVRPVQPLNTRSVTNFGE